MVREDLQSPHLAALKLEILREFHHEITTFSKNSEFMIKTAVIFIIDDGLSL